MITARVNDQLPFGEEMITITIQYFAILREQRGATREQLTTCAVTPESLYQELRAKYNFTLPIERVRAAVNGDFVTRDAVLQEGDDIVFIPPVAGG